MVDTNKLVDFPRQGRRRNEGTGKTKIRAKRVMTDDLFKTGNQDSSNKAKKSKERKKKTKEDEEDEVAVIEELNVRSLPIGSTVLGCIQEIREFEMKLSLPGDIQCVIPITNISELYTEALQNFADDAVNNAPPLKPKSMFRVGECFPVKVMEKKEDNHTFQGTSVTRIHVIGSLDPKEVYDDVVSSTFVKCCTNLIMSSIVVSVEDHGYIMDIGVEGLKAFLSKEDSEPFLERLNVNSLSVGQLLLCKIKSCDNRIVKLQSVTKQSVITGTESTSFSTACLFPGLHVAATVMDVSDKGLHIMVMNEFKGFVHKNHLKTVWDLPSRDYKIAQNVKGTILYRNPITKVVAISLRKMMDPENLTEVWSGIRVGQIVKKATVVGKDENGTVVLKFKGALKALIPKNQLSDDFLTPAEFAEYENKLEIGTNHKFRIKSICYIDGCAKGTVKPSVLAKDDLAVDDIEVGGFVTGKVKKLTEKGLVLQLGYNVQGFVPNIHLTETGNVQNPEKLFPLDKEVKCRVIRIDKSVEPPKIALTCKKSLMKKNLLILDYFKKAEIGLETDGVIALINEYGVLIEFFNGVRGFAPLNLLSEAKITNAHSMFKVGQVVHCIVASALPSKGKLIISLIPLKSDEENSFRRKRNLSVSDNEQSVNPKKSKKLSQELSKQDEEISQAPPSKNNNFESTPPARVRKNSDQSEKVKEKIELLVNQLAKISGKEERKRKRSESEVEEQVRNEKEDHKNTQRKEHESNEDNQRKSKKDKRSGTQEPELKSKKEVSKNKSDTSKVIHEPKAKKCLPVKEGFDWNDDDEDVSEEEIDSSEEEGTENAPEKKKKSRKERNEEARKREEALRKREEVLMDKTRVPETVDDFERKVLSSPNSSIVWIHYISFHLEAGEIDKARSIAERALISISFREENEKFNIWVALLNLENEFGDDESLNAVFTRALQMNDPLKVYNHMVRVYEDAKKLKEAEQMFELMCRKFKKEKQVWINFAMFLMRHNEAEKARKLLEKSLRSVEMRHHVDLISKFSQIEFQFGEFERGKTMFENLISNCPKRVDLWSVFIDMMIKHASGDNSESLASIRSVFERAITLQLNVKKMRTIFRKYLDFEIKHGNDDTVARIRQKAKEYVEENPFSSNEGL